MFIVGPGFIGWNVLDLLIAEGYSVTGFVRRKEHREQMKDSATADHLPSAEAVLDGVKERASSRKSTIFLHTSGTSLLTDLPKVTNNQKSGNIYHENHHQEVDSLPDDATHGEIDLAILNAQKELDEKGQDRYHDQSLIYGFNSDHGRLTIQIPALTRFASKHGVAAHVGKGEDVESNLHVKDLARAYIGLLHYMESSPLAKVLENYSCEATVNKKPSWEIVAELIGEQLERSRIQSLGLRRRSCGQMCLENFQDWS